ncbi:MAG: hypothetical protein U5L03_16680 [Burkholderiaceae bacterium]|nr:hypothetical protein [Burkholderiaceae bacterium]
MIERVPEKRLREHGQKAASTPWKESALVFLSSIAASRLRCGAGMAPVCSDAARSGMAAGVSAAATVS